MLGSINQPGPLLVLNRIVAAVSGLPLVRFERTRDVF